MVRAATVSALAGAKRATAEARPAGAYDRPVTEREAIERILHELVEPGGFDAAERRIGETAPQLQSVLDAALRAGGWFDEAFEGAVLKAATMPDGQARIDALRAFAHEQTRLGMLVGVAVGWEIAERLARERLEDDFVPPDLHDQAGEG